LLNFSNLCYINVNNNNNNFDILANQGYVGILAVK